MACAAPSLASAALIEVDDDMAECPTAAFTSIQTAIDDPATVDGDEIHVCTGTYEEQVTDAGKDLVIDGDGQGNVTVRSPAVLSTGSCDTTSANRAIICVSGGADTTIRELTVDGVGLGNANDRFVGVAFRNSEGVIQDVTVTDVRNEPLAGTTSGTGILGAADAGTTRTLEISGSTIQGFQKNGIALGGSDLEGEVTNNIVEGVGPQDLIAQSGIRLSTGASGTVTGNTISNIDFTENTTCATGVLLLGHGPGTVAQDNAITDVHCSLYAQDGPAVQFLDNTVTGARYGVSLFENSATVSGNSLTSGPALDSKGIFACTTAGPICQPSGPMIVVANSNTLLGFNGVALSGDGPSLTMAAHFNRIDGDGTGAQNLGGASMDVENNWWGCNEGPNMAGCVPVSGTPDFNPWLVLGVSASPTSISPGGDTSTITADLTKNSNGATAGPGFPDTDVFFQTTLGTIAPDTAPTSNGIATTTLTSDATEGTALVNASLDQETQGVSVTIGTPPAPDPPPPSTTATTGQRAAALKKCKKKRKGKPRQRCKARARRLPV